MQREINSVLFSDFIWHCDVCCMQCGVISVQFVVCSVQYAVVSWQFLVSSVQLAVCSWQCAVESVQLKVSSLHHAGCIL